MTFTEAVHTWQTYYLLLGGAAATLAGLLFIGLSPNLNVAHINENVGVQSWTTQTFANFIHLFLISILFLIPDQTPVGLGIPLLLLSLLGIYDVGNLLRRVYLKQHRLRTLGLIARFMLPLGAFAVLAVCAVLVLNQQLEAFIGLVGMEVILILSSTRNVWDLMFNLRARYLQD
jgi:hypothetical protein